MKLVLAMATVALTAASVQADGPTVISSSSDDSSSSSTPTVIGDTAPTTTTLAPNVTGTNSTGGLLGATAGSSSSSSSSSTGGSFCCNYITMTCHSYSESMSGPGWSESFSESGCETHCVGPSPPPPPPPSSSCYADGTRLQFSGNTYSCSYCCSKNCYAYNFASGGVQVQCGSRTPSPTPSPPSPPSPCPGCTPGQPDKQQTKTLMEQMNAEGQSCAKDSDCTQFVGLTGTCGWANPKGTGFYNACVYSMDPVVN